LKERQDNAVKPGERLSILVADDDVSLRRAFSIKLRQDGGFDIMTAATCEEALAKAISNQPDLILLDVKFEEGEEAEDGINCLEKMRAQGYKGPVFIFSGHTDLDFLKRAQKAGADDYLVKGDFVDLAGEVKRLLLINIQRVLSGENFNRILNSGYLRTMGLTDSQVEALSLMVQEGYPQDKDLLERLGMSIGAFEMMMHRIRKELNVQNTKQLVRILTLLELFGNK